jgi:putative ABC transport system permease protein
MFLRFVLQALRYRKQRLLLAFGALTIAATLATILFGIYSTMEQRLRNEFRSYGANLIAVPTGGEGSAGTIPLDLATAAEHMGAEAAPFLITSTQINGIGVAVAGFDPVKAAPLTTYWRVTGDRNLAHGECLAGDLLHLSIGAKTSVCTVKGVISTGGAEDRELLVPFDDAAALAGTHNAASVIEIRAPGDRVESVRAALAAQFPAADVRTVLAVVNTESNVVLKMRTSLLLLTLIVLGITVLCVSSNFSEMVLERSKEVGILKALGGAERRIAAFFVSESALLAVTATLVGYLAGIFCAAAIGSRVFGVGFHLQISSLVFLSVSAVMLFVAIVSTAIGTSRIWKIEPAIILRGE